MDDFNKALSAITGRVQELSTNIDENAKHGSKISQRSHDQITQDISSLLTDIKILYATLSQIMLALPKLSSSESLAPLPTKLETLATSMDTLLHSRHTKLNFASLCEELLRASHLYKQTWNVAHIAEITAMAQLARYPALLSFPSRTAGLSIDVAEAVREQVNDCIAPEPPVSLERVLLLTKGLLIADQRLENHSVIWFLTKGCLGISERMSDVELVESVRNALVRRADVVRMAEERIEGMVEVAFGEWDVEQIYCCNIFRELDVGEFLDEYKETFEEVKRKWRLVCACEFCVVVRVVATARRHL